MTKASHRAGQYIRQLAGYRAFAPAPLPPDPPVQVEGPIQSALSRAALRWAVSIAPC
jgi:hypothetical protein